MATKVVETDPRFGELVDRTAAGEVFEFERDGHVVAKLVPVEPLYRGIDFEGLARLRAKTPVSRLTVEEMRRLDLL